MGTGEPWDTVNLTHLDPAALLNMTIIRSSGTGEPWDTAEPDSSGSSGTAEHDSYYIQGYWRTLGYC